MAPAVSYDGASIGASLKVSIQLAPGGAGREES